MKFLCVLGLMFSLYASADEPEVSNADTNGEMSNMRTKSYCMAQENYAICRRRCNAQARNFISSKRRFIEVEIFYARCISPCRQICSFPNDHLLIVSPAEYKKLQIR